VKELETTIDGKKVFFGETKDLKKQLKDFDGRADVEKAELVSIKALMVKPRPLGKMTKNQRKRYRKKWGIQ
jgi:hypothetical protein